MSAMNFLDKSALRQMIERKQARIDELSDAGTLILASLKEMVACYGSDDGGGPIPIIARAKEAIEAGNRV